MDFCAWNNNLFLTFPACFLIPIWILIVLMYQIWENSRNKLKNIRFQKLLRPFTAPINFSNDFKKFANYQPSATNFKSFFPKTRTFFSHRRWEQFWKQNTRILIQNIFWIKRSTVDCRNLNSFLAENLVRLRCGPFFFFGKGF